MAFKVKTTAPKLYCVRPNASVIRPGESAKISITLQGFTKPLPKDYKCKDKFLIVSCPCPTLDDPTKVAENWASLNKLYGEKEVQKKLRVNFIVEEDSTDEPHAEDTTFANTSQLSPARDYNNTTLGGADTTLANDKSIHTPVTQPDTTVNESILPSANNTVINNTVINDTDKELEHSNTQIDSLSKKLDSTEAEPKPKIAAVDETVNGISFPFAFILVVLALLLGWYIF